MSLDLLRQLYQTRNAASVGTSWRIDSAGAFKNVSGVVSKYVEDYLDDSGLPAEEKAIVIDYDNFFKNLLVGNEAKADSIFSQYNDLHTAALYALAKDPSKGNNPYSQMIAAFVWSIHKDAESVCKTLGDVAKLLENPANGAADYDICLCTLWVLLSGIHNYGRP
jgi:hypothetical protein